jgi:hypothetical protein
MMLSSAHKGDQAMESSLDLTDVAIAVRCVQSIVRVELYLPCNNPDCNTRITRYISSIEAMNHAYFNLSFDAIEAKWIIRDNKIYCPLHSGEKVNE